MKIISFSLYGTEKVYYDGALENLVLSKAIYPEWKCRFYVSRSVSDGFREKIIEYGGEVFPVDDYESEDEGLFWRFLPASDPEVDVMIVRDLDARLSVRGRHAVNEWLDSGRSVHIMRDHPGHRSLILGGAWGCLNGAIPDMDILMRRHIIAHRPIGYGDDVDFLSNEIYPIVHQSIYVNSELVAFEGEEVHPFPTRRKGNEWVGFPVSRGALTRKRIIKFLSGIRGGLKTYRLEGGRRVPIKSKLDDFRLIHIGKCGGTSVRVMLSGISQFHHQKPKFEDGIRYIIWLRNPLNRFVSAFNMSLSIINQDVSGMTIGQIDIGTSLAPLTTIKKIETGYAYTEDYENLVSYFRTPNRLAESISSSDLEIREKAFRLMTDTTEHIYKGIGWYLSNGEFVKDHGDNIFFVGKVETMREDTEMLLRELGIQSIECPFERQNKEDHDSFLSEMAIKNLIKFYTDSDYAALRQLNLQGWIDDTTLASYYEYTG